MNKRLSTDELGIWLEDLYDHYNDRSFAHPDPVEFLYEYEEPGDREIVAFIASTLAYGRVEQILISVRKALSLMGKSPLDYSLSRKSGKMNSDFSSFRHRFTTGAQLSTLIGGLGEMVRRHGSVGDAFHGHLKNDEKTVQGAMEGFVEELSDITGTGFPFLLPTPVDGSACKRFCLMLRWLVRSDEVDPGGWNNIPMSKLIVPLDTHMFREATRLGLTRRKSADFRAALEVTEAFASLRPDDPVRYDFALTRLGIRPEVERKEATR